MNATAPSENIEIDALAERIAENAAMVDSAIHRLLTDLRQFDTAKGWGRQGMLSCAHWLNWRCGIALGAAREKLRVAHALGELRLIDAAMQRGEVSYSKARAVTRVATPDNEGRLVELCRYTTASQLEKMCRLYDQTLPHSPRPDQPQRWLRVRSVEDGMVRLEVQLRPEEAERVLAACDASAETRPDGLVAMAEATLRGDQPDRPPAEVIVHVDAETLTGRTEESGVPAETSRRLLCDAAMVRLVEDGSGTPLHLGRKTRVISTPLRRALISRDGCCRFPGCERRRYVDAHHVVHWADGGETALVNTLLLCSTHHTSVHEGGFRIAGDATSARFFSPDGQEVPPAGLPPEAKTPHPRTPPTRSLWDGTPVDYGAAVEYMIARP